MAISRFQSSFKVRKDLMDSMTPNNVVQREVSTPAGEWKPAAWLPVVWQNEKSKDYFTISSGKVVSLDSYGRIVPSGLLRKCLDISDANDINANEAIITYDANDVAARVIDITTGKFVTGSKSVFLRGFIHAAIDSGWINAAKPAANNNAAELLALQGLAKQFISAPVGVAAYDVYCWAGDDPANLHFTNYQKQHLIQFFTDIQMRVPHVCEAAGTVDIIPDVANAALRLNATDLTAMPRYAGLDMSNVVGYRIAEKFASHTSRTPVSLVTGAGAWSGRLRSEIALLGKAGDYFLDGDAGITLFYEEGGNQTPVDAAGQGLTDGTACGYNSSSQQARMIHLVGAAKPGDFVTFDAQSNFVVRSLPTTVAADGDDDGAEASAALLAFADELELTVGRVLELIKEPRGLLERVRTGFKGDEFEADAKMPGSATGGFSDLITLSDEIVADEIAVINIKVQ